MGIFSDILEKLRYHGAQPQPSSSQQQAQPANAPGQQGGGQPGLQLQSVDVDATLSQLAAKKNGGGNWRTSIVDLLKLLDLDSSLDARKRLADELDVHEGAPGSAEENIALHKAVMRKVAENGGKVPDNLKH
jgi:hypothetical protein